MKLGSYRTVSNFLHSGEIYNHFKRYGYEYQTDFRLIEKRQLRNFADPSSDCFAELRPACGLIPFLDNLLQLFLDDVKGLALPTRIRNVTLLPGALTEWQGGAVETRTSSEDGSTTSNSSERRRKNVTAVANFATRTVRTKTCTVVGLEVTATVNGRVPQKLVHVAQQFVELGWVEERNALEEAVRSARVDLICERLVRYFAGVNSSSSSEPNKILVEKPWLSKVLEFAKLHVGPSSGDSFATSSSSPRAEKCSSSRSFFISEEQKRAFTDYRFYDGLTDSTEKMESLLNNPMLTLSLHAEHEAIYGNDSTLVSPQRTLAEVWAIRFLPPHPTMVAHLPRTSFHVCPGSHL